MALALFKSSFLKGLARLVLRISKLGSGAESSARLSLISCVLIAMLEQPAKINMQISAMMARLVDVLKSE